MTSGEMAASGLSDAEHSAQLRRAIIASTVGTVIEAYDFLLYVLAARSYSRNCISRPPTR